jgi:hypothetical protein
MKTNRKLTVLPLALGAMLWACAPLNAVTIYLFDNFGSGLDQWTGYSNQSGVTVPQAGHGQVLTFNSPTSGGDAWSIANVPAGSYLSFDYMGSGGFIGVAGVWLAGWSSYPGVEQALTYDDTWRHYEVLVPTSGRIIIEICSASWASGSPQSAFFDNILVCSEPNDPQPGDADPVPEGGVGLLGILALLGLCGVNQRRRA